MRNHILPYDIYCVFSESDGREITVRAGEYSNDIKNPAGAYTNIWDWLQGEIIIDHDDYSRRFSGGEVGHLPLDGLRLVNATGPGPREARHIVIDLLEVGDDDYDHRGGLDFIDDELENAIKAYEGGTR